MEAIRPHVHRRRLYVATDGSSREGVGAMGWAVQLPANRLSTGDALQDQSSFRLEVKAVHLLFQALEALFLGAMRIDYWLCLEVICVVDCQSAIQAFEGASAFDLSFLVQDVQHIRAKLHAANVDTVFVWTPSHGKQPLWTPPACHDPEYLRRLNAAADVAARECMERRLQGSSRQQWARASRAAAQWEYAAIMRVADVSRRYHSFLMTRGLRPRERPIS